MKEHFMEELNKLKDEEALKSLEEIKDDYDWISPSSELLDPPADVVDLTTGKQMWVIKGYKIWAYSYKQALELLPMIEGF